MTKSLRAKRARSANNSMASSDSDSEGTCQPASPVTPSGSRLVASTVSLGAAPRMAATNEVDVSSRCSQLSCTSSIWRSQRCCCSVSMVDLPGWSGRSNARTTVTGHDIRMGDRC